MKYILVDIDGTICDSSHRKHEEYNKIKKDKVINNICNMVSKLQDLTYYQDGCSNFDYEKTHKICFITGRKEDSVKETNDWIINHYIAEDYDLYMRKNTDTRPCSQVKKDIYNKFLKNKDILCVFENDPDCIKMYRKLGLFVIDCNNGKGEF
ncbi:hypothetical protein ACFX5K_03775 [Rickettsiales bacterium LUAb2]